MHRHFDFECGKCHSVFEEMISDDSMTLPCPSCGGTSNRLISAPSISWRLMGIDPGFPGAYAKWGKNKTKHHKSGKDSMHNGKGNNLLMY